MDCLYIEEYSGAWAVYNQEYISRWSQSLPLVSRRWARLLTTALVEWHARMPHASSRRAERRKGTLADVKERKGIVSRDGYIPKAYIFALLFACVLMIFKIWTYCFAGFYEILILKFLPVLGGHIWPRKTLLESRLWHIHIFVANCPASNEEWTQEKIDQWQTRQWKNYEECLAKRFQKYGVNS